MSATTTAWLTIVGIGVGTFAIRASFLLFATRLTEVPRPIRETLRMIPAAALAALAAPALLRPEGTLQLTTPELLAGLLAAAVAWRTRNVLATVVVGLLAIVLLDTLSSWAR